MPIGQLLASITGEKAATPTSIQPSRSSNGLPPKRKADQDGPGSAFKNPKTVPGSNGPTNSAASRPYTGSSRPSPSNATRTLTERPASTALKKPSLGPAARPSPTSASFAGAARNSPVSSLMKRSTPPITAPPATSDSGKAPKKGSIAEIRARAAAQQEKLQGIGKIQHKSADKQMTKKEREEAAAEEAKITKKGSRPPIRPGAGGLPTRTGPGGPQRMGNGSGHLDRARGAIQKPESGRPLKNPIREERKVKKAALATTGYQGSARPVAGKGKPGAARSGAPGAGRSADRGLEKRPNPMGMFNKPRRRADEDDYDEELDDFVVDDEEEDEPGYGGRYSYAVDSDESDMEAGYYDVEDEETAAAKAARLEDAREEQILAQKKREKEARRKAALQNRR